LNSTFIDTLVGEKDKHTNCTAKSTIIIIMFMTLLIASIVFAILSLLHIASSPALMSPFELQTNLQKTSYELPRRVVKLCVAVFNIVVMILHLEPIAILSFHSIDTVWIVVTTYLIFDCIQEVKMQFEYNASMYKRIAFIQAQQLHNYVSRSQSKFKTGALQNEIQLIQFEPISGVLMHHIATILFIAGVGFNGTRSMLYGIIFADLSTMFQQMYSLLNIVHENMSGITKHHNQVESRTIEQAINYRPIVAKNEERSNSIRMSKRELNGGLSQAMYTSVMLIPALQFFSHASLFTYGLRILIFISIALGDLIWKIEVYNPIAWALSGLMLIFFKNNVESFLAIYGKTVLGKMCNLSKEENVYKSF
jgi:hypothetical protein